MEETISRMAGAEWGIRMEPSEIRTAITSIGRTPVERSTTYERLQRNTNGHSRHAPMAPSRAAIGERTPSNGRFRQGD
jgi:hypothetical protein